MPFNIQIPKYEYVVKMISEVIEEKERKTSLGSRS